MLQDEELEVRMMFLDEATEYIDNIEDGLVDLDPYASTFRQKIDAVLRAAHSLKGSAAMMQYDILSQAVHRLEDSFKILKENRPAINTDIERLLLNSSDILRQIVRQYKQRQTIEPEWLQVEVFPIFDELETQLDASEATEARAEDEEEEVNLVAMMFESEVENYLEQLEGLVTDPEPSPTLSAEVASIAEDLAGIGEMLELNNFVALCQSVTQALEAKSRLASEIAHAALAAWRNAQALVEIGNTDAIRTEIELPPLDKEELGEILEEVYVQLAEDTLDLAEELDITNADFFADADDLAYRAEPQAEITDTETDIEDVEESLSIEDLGNITAEDSEEFVDLGISGIERSIDIEGVATEYPGKSVDIKDEDVKGSVDTENIEGVATAYPEKYVDLGVEDVEWSLDAEDIEVLAAEYLEKSVDVVTDAESLDNEEREVRMMFLEEATEYINAIDDGLVDFDSSASNFKQQIDSVLRAAHSLKGGAAMMQYDALSQAAHRLEDSFKILKDNRPAIDTAIETLLFNSAEILRQIVRQYKQGNKVTSAWLEKYAFPIFVDLEAQLNAAEATAAGIEDEEEEVNLVAMMFESEVESYLERLESLLIDLEVSPTLNIEIASIAEDLAAIGEMLELSNFAALSQSVTQALEAKSRSVNEIANAALTAWRNAQALVEIGNTDAIASQIDLPPLIEAEIDKAEEVELQLVENISVDFEEELDITDTEFLYDADDLVYGAEPQAEIVAPDPDPKIQESLKSLDIENEENITAESLEEPENIITDVTDRESLDIENVEDVVAESLEEPEDIVADEEPLDSEEREVRKMFLEEATEYINAIDGGLEDFDSSASNFKQQVDSVLRAAHSLKGGAAMMQYDALSQAAHRLEDSFKLLKENRPAIDTDIERLLFNSADILRQIVRQYKQGSKVTSGWLENYAFPIFVELEAQLNAAEATGLGAEDEEEEVNLVAMMFESEVESYLERLEGLIADPEASPTLNLEIASIAEDLAAIGEMLELPNFATLSQSVTQALEAKSSSTSEIANAALAAWRNAQALVEIGNTGAIATQIDLSPLAEEGAVEVEEVDIQIAEYLPELLENLDITDAEFLADAEEFTPNDTPLGPDQSITDVSTNVGESRESIESQESIESEVVTSELTSSYLLADAEMTVEEFADDIDGFADLTDLDEFTDLEDLPERSQLTDSSESSVEPDDDLNVFPSEPDELIFEVEGLDTPFKDMTLEAFIFESVFDVEDNVDLFSTSDNTRIGKSISPVPSPVSKQVSRPKEPKAETQSAPKLLQVKAKQQLNPIEKTQPVTEPESQSPEVLPNTVEPVLDRTVSPRNNTNASLQPSQSKADSPEASDRPNTSTSTTVVVQNGKDRYSNQSIGTSSGKGTGSTTSTNVNRSTSNPRIDRESSLKTESKPTIPSKDAQKSASNDLPELRTGKGKDFSAYVRTSDQEKAPNKSKVAPKPQDAADSLFELFEDLDASQESNDLPASLPKSISDMVSAYLKEASIRLPVSRLEQMYDISEELSIGNNGVDQQLRRLRSIVKLLDGRMRDLETTNVQLQSAYDRMTLQNSLGQSESIGELDKVNTTTALVEPITGASDAIPEASPYADFDNLEMDRYSELHSLSQSVIETIVQLEEAISDVNLTLAEAEQNAANQNRHFKQLQMAIAQIRMRPISDVVGKFSRVIRSLSLQFGKDVELEIKGGETPVDRVILDALSDPLNHILRNAFDHGIESAAIRAERGKPAQGKITIETSLQSDKILVAIQDDGGGIDAEKIRNKVRRMALESGKDASQVDRIPRQKLLSLIFEPGFSTADKVTSLSGRGVGMDVVQTNLKQIGAKISIDTEVGTGTTFTISIPFTLLSTRVLIIQVDQMILSIPSSAIAGVMACNATDILSVENGYGFMWEGQTIPVIQLGDRLRLNCQHQISYMDDRIVTSGSAIIIVDINDELVAIQADAFWSEQEATIRQIEGNIKLPKFFSGCIILGSGQAVPLLDLNEVAVQFLSGADVAEVAEVAEVAKAIASESEPKSEPELVLPESKAVQSSRRVSILVVDDSINVRRFLALTLEKAGFRVEQAKDGEEALAKIVDGLQVSAVVSDVEMPRLDGFGLLSQLRAKPDYKTLPVVMLTSRSGDKHRRLAMNLGATGYFTKPYQEQELVKTLKELTKKSDT